MITSLSELVREKSGFFLMLQILGQTAAPVTQSSIASITCNLFDLDSLTPGIPIQTAALVVSTVIFDTMQTDARWTKDAIGYNFGHAVPATWMTLGGRHYRLEYYVTPTIGEPFFLPPILPRTQEMFSL